MSAIEKSSASIATFPPRNNLKEMRAKQKRAGVRFLVLCLGLVLAAAGTRATAAPAPPGQQLPGASPDLGRVASGQWKVNDNARPKPEKAAPEKRGGTGRPAKAPAERDHPVRRQGPFRLEAEPVEVAGRVRRGSPQGGLSRHERLLRLLPPAPGMVDARPASGHPPDARQQRRFPDGALRGPGARHLRQSHLRRRHRRGDLRPDPAVGQPDPSARAMAVLRHRFPPPDFRRRQKAGQSRPR